MTERELFILIKAVLDTGLSARNITATVEQNYQPVQQGAAEAATIYLTKIDDTPVGMPHRNDVPDPDTEDGMLHTETQWMVTRFQFNALVTQNPSDPNRMTASDLLNAARRIVQSDAAAATFKAAGANIFQPREGRNPQFLNERGRFQASPSFDLMLTHELTETTPIPAITPPVDFVIRRV